MATVVVPIELGYIDEERPVSHLISQFFPSKLGGLPAWLAFDPLPTSDSLKCRTCGHPMCFLMQVYAPVATQPPRPDLFHRTIFLFICRNPECCTPNGAQNMAAFRSQLPRANPFYGFEPLDPDLFDPKKPHEGVKSVRDFHNVCIVCGCAGTSHCGQCGLVQYCSKAHQELHWKSGHKADCKTADSSSKASVFSPNPFLFPEYELFTEREHYVPDAPKEERPEAERMQDYKRFLHEQLAAKQKDKANADNQMLSATGDNATYDLEAYAKDEDKCFKHFQRRVAQNPDQVLRYQRGGTPLWASTAIPKPIDIPACEKCGSSRVFEFQLMPIMLEYMEVDTVGKSLDWATVAVYTCSNSCSIEGYQREFLWKQDYD